jgi:hypothetical protein
VALAAAREFWAASAVASFRCFVPVTIPGGKLLKVPGPDIARFPLITVFPVLVILLPESTVKFDAFPKEIQCIVDVKQYAKLEIADGAPKVTTIVRIDVAAEREKV